MRRLGAVSRPQGLPHEILFCSNAAKRHDTLAEFIQRRPNGRLCIVSLRLSFVGLTWSSAKFGCRGCSGRDHSEKLRVETSDSSRLWFMMKSCVLFVDTLKRKEKIFLKV
jgi:hypothetical protein